MLLVDREMSRPALFQLCRSDTIQQSSIAVVKELQSAYLLSSNSLQLLALRLVQGTAVLEFWHMYLFHLAASTVAI